MQAAHLLQPLERKWRLEMRHVSVKLVELVAYVHLTLTMDIQLTTCIMTTQALGIWSSLL